MALMSADKRKSDRLIPMVTDEEMVVVECDGRHVLAKMMDLSETGTLLYLLLDSGVDPGISGQCELSLYHEGNVFNLTALLARQTGRLIGFQFLPGAEDSPHLQAKLIRMEVEWNRLRSLV